MAQTQLLQHWRACLHALSNCIPLQLVVCVEQDAEPEPEPELLPPHQSALPPHLRSWQGRCIMELASEHLDISNC